MTSTANISTETSEEFTSITTTRAPAAKTSQITGSSTTTTVRNVAKLPAEAEAETTELINQIQLETSELEDGLEKLDEQLNLLEENSLSAQESEEKAEIAKLNAEQVLAEASAMLNQIEKIKDSAAAVLDLLANILSSFDQVKRSADDIIARATCEDLIANIGRMNDALQLGTKEGLKIGSGYAGSLLEIKSPYCSSTNADDLSFVKYRLMVSLASVVQVVAEEREVVSRVTEDLVDPTLV